ncbi:MULTISPECIES: hypothetical protein [Streptomyces]|uniref:Ribbon-helix-helix protein CopG domain-containing protein n=1 Tax=Streptomyces solicathayae TaxID=3081768 RepID=A0ABZ0LXG6_9ACTN|nr:hypothetical protein [Streptomyces sp. HUAS YS2]WOX24107.1 hypothetical protein R2D22_23090 [Streptomyces sp. HUAS YS2]
MQEITVSVPPELVDLADARGVSVEAQVEEAMGRFLATKDALVRHEAMRLALRHASLLRRLGE